MALAGLGAYVAGLSVALVPFVRTALRRPPHTAAAFMLGAGLAWFAFAVLADLAALVASSRVVDLDGRVGRLIPAVTAGFALQTLTGALTYLLPVVFGRSTFATASSAASGPGLAAARGRDQSWRRAAGRLASRRMGVTMGWWLAGLGVGGFVPLAAAALLASYLRTEEAK